MHRSFARKLRPSLPDRFHVLRFRGLAPVRVLNDDRDIAERRDVYAAGFLKSARAVIRRDGNLGVIGPLVV